MSGHSKWSKVKHQKATTDAVKSTAFTRASRAITVAVHEGGGIGNPDKNFRLRLAIEKAHDVKRCGVLVVEKNGKIYDDMLNAALFDGVDDVIEQEDMFEVYTSPTAVVRAKNVLTQQGWLVDNWEIIMKPQSCINPDATIRQRNEELISQLESLDDVQHVFSNLA